MTMLRRRLVRKQKQCRGLYQNRPNIDTYCFRFRSLWTAQYSMHQRVFQDAFPYLLESSLFIDTQSKFLDFHEARICILFKGLSRSSRSSLDPLRHSILFQTQSRASC